MQRAKDAFFAITQSLSWGNAQHNASPNREPLTTTLHILTCDGKPIAAYKHMPVAEYEMWLCRKGQECMGDPPSTYEIFPVSVCEAQTPYEWTE